MNKRIDSVNELSVFNDIMTTSTGNLYTGGKYVSRTPWFDEEEKLFNSIL